MLLKTPPSSSSSAPGTLLRTNKPAATTSTRLNDSYDDQYAQFYNQAVDNEATEAEAPLAEIPNGDIDDEVAAALAAAAESLAAAEAASLPPSPPAAAAAPAVPPPLSYFESMTRRNGGDTPTEASAYAQQQQQQQQQSVEVEVEEEQVYYEATNSYEAPEATPDPGVAAAAEAAPMTAAAAEYTTGVPDSDPIPSAKPFGVPPAQSNSSPTLSAQMTVPDTVPAAATARSSSANTFSVTLGVPALPKLEPGKVIPFGEASRQYRRTVYTHEDWVRHRSPDRFLKYVVNIVNSGVYKNVGREVIVLTCVTLFVLIYNGSVLGYQDLAGLPQPAVLQSNFLPPLTLPLAPFTLSSSFLGLLVAFRSNEAYQRWDEGRKNWGMNINHTRDLNRMANAYYDRTGVTEEKRQADLERLAWCTWAFVRSMKRHLSPEAEDEAEFKAELYEKLPKSQAAHIIAAAHRPNRALFDLSLAIENLPMHFLRKNALHKSLTIFEDNLGSSELLLTSPVPLIYNRHTARFLIVWVMLLPFAMWEPFGNMWNHIGLMPTMAVVGIMLFGIEELATQLEEPFTVLPMQAFCDKIGNWCNEIASWEDGTNGITTNRSYQGRTRTDV